MKKSAQRDANTARALAVVRFGHRPPVTNKQTGPITIHCAAKLSAQCKERSFPASSRLLARIPFHCLPCTADIYSVAKW